MKCLGLEQTTLDACVQAAQGDQVVLTRNGDPVAVVVGIEGWDEEQIALGYDREFWSMIAERRRGEAISREELERILDEEDRLAESTQAAHRVLGGFSNPLPKNGPTDANS